MNPAEYVLEAIGAGVTPHVGNRPWSEIWLESPEYQKAKQEVADMKAKVLREPREEQRRISTCELVVT
jgi:ATP-binding cassette, subfamily G (WHITE), member 2, SNQ2